VALVLIGVIVSGAVFAGLALALFHAQSRIAPQALSPGVGARVGNDVTVLQVAARAAPAIATIITSETASDRRLGAGFMATGDGYIVTNAHVVANSDMLTVLLGTDGLKRDARLVDSDCQTDLAVLKVDGVSGIPTLGFGDPAGLRVGQSVVAMGGQLDTPGPAPSGIITGLHRLMTVNQPVAAGADRRLGDTIQTDAPIDLSNSGGPLLNLSGQVVGISVAATTGGRPVAFAVSVADVEAEVEQIVRDGSLVVPDLGISWQDLSGPESGLRGVGAVIDALDPGGPGELARLRVGDVITAVDENRLDAGHPLAQVLNARFRPGQRVALTLNRQGSTLQLQATLGRRHPHCG